MISAGMNVLVGRETVSTGAAVSTGRWKMKRRLPSRAVLMTGAGADPGGYFQRALIAATPSAGAGPKKPSISKASE